MARKIVSKFIEKPKVRRKGRHSKSASNLKSSQLYKKPYNRQGRK